MCPRPLVEACYVFWAEFGVRKTLLPRRVAVFADLFTSCDEFRRARRAEAGGGRAHDRILHQLPRARVRGGLLFCQTRIERFLALHKKIDPLGLPSQLIRPRQHWPPK